MQQKVLVLGANGRFGRVVATAFADAGWQVIAQARRALLDPPRESASHLATAVTDSQAVIAAAQDAKLVINAMNPLYTQWDSQALPLHNAAIAIACGLNATLMLPGNVYNFGAHLPEQLTEQVPEQPTTRKGNIRCAMEQAMRKPGLSSIVVRAGDFLGGPGAGTWFDQVIVKHLPRGKIIYPGPLEIKHAWAYLPDLANTFVRLAETRAELAPHACFHFPGYNLTGSELINALVLAARQLGILEGEQTPSVKGIPWKVLGVLGIVYPLWRELANMSYLWRQPHSLVSLKLEQAIGEIPNTPLVAALEQSLLELKQCPGGRNPPTRR